MTCCWKEGDKRFSSLCQEIRGEHLARMVFVGGWKAPKGWGGIVDIQGCWMMYRSAP